MIEGAGGRAIMRGCRTWGVVTLVATAAAVAAVTAGGGVAMAAGPPAATVMGRQAALSLGGGRGSRDLRRTVTEAAVASVASLPASHVDASASWLPHRYVPPHPWSVCTLTTVDAVAAALTRTIELSLPKEKGGGRNGSGGGMPCAARYFAPLLAPLSWMASRTPPGYLCIPNAYFEAIGWHAANYATAAASQKTPRLLAMDAAAPGGCAMSARLIQALHQENAAWACAYDRGGGGGGRKAAGYARRRWVPHFCLCSRSVQVRVKVMPPCSMERARWKACQLRRRRDRGSRGVGGRGSNGGGSGSGEHRGGTLPARARQAAPAHVVPLGLQPPAPLFTTGYPLSVAIAARQGNDVVIGNDNVDGGGGIPPRQGDAPAVGVTPPRGPAGGRFRPTQSSTDVRLEAFGGGHRRDEPPVPPRRAMTAEAVVGGNGAAPLLPRLERICRVCPPEYVGVSAAWCCARYCRAFEVGLDIAVSSRMATRTGCCEKLIKACVQLK